MNFKDFLQEASMESFVVNTGVTKTAYVGVPKGTYVYGQLYSPKLNHSLTRAWLDIYMRGIATTAGTLNPKTQQVDGMVWVGFEKKGSEAELQRAIAPLIKKINELNKGK